MRDFYCGKDFKGDPPLTKKILAGLTTGAFGISIANPTVHIEKFARALIVIGCGES